MKSRLHLALLFALAAVLSSCAPPPENTSKREVESAKRLAERILEHPNIELMKRQVSGRYDNASAYHNIVSAKLGYAAKRSSYGRAPGGYVRLDPELLRGMLTLADRGYRYRVTSIAGGSHSRRSRHYVGVAVDVDKINGVRVRHGGPHWRFRKHARALGATETKGPGDRGHSGHVHIAWPRPRS